MNAICSYFPDAIGNIFQIVMPFNNRNVRATPLTACYPMPNAAAVPLGMGDAYRGSGEIVLFNGVNVVRR